MAFDPRRVAVTAKLAAYYRRFTDIPFAEEAAARVGADEAFEGLVATHGLDPAQLAFYAVLFEARYKSISALLERWGATQVLELASGYSLRGLDLTRDPRVRYVETDLPDVVAEKAALLEAVRRAHRIAPSPGHALVAADALDASAIRAAAAGFRRDRPLVVLCEGLIQYLTRADVEHLARHLRALLLEFPGGRWVTSDFQFASESRDLSPERRRLREVVAGITERAFDGATFEDAAELAAFLDRSGYDVATHLQIDETPAFSSIAALGLSPAVLDRFRPRLRMWTTTPRG